MSIGKAGAIAVDRSGAVHGVSGATGKVTTLPVVADRFARPTVVDTALRSPSPDITAVGSRWVAYDAAKDTVHTEADPEGIDAQVTAPGSSRYAALQQPGPDADTVAVAGPVRTVLVPLDGGTSPGGVAIQEQVDRVAGSTLVTRPVVLGGCLHAAWAEAGQVFYGANCGRRGDQPTATLPAKGEEDTRDGVAFRVNRGIVVLNDLDNGGVWDLDDKPTKIDNWDALVPPTKQDDDNDKKDENLVDEASLNTPPKAEPDDLSVRPGRTSKLHVLDNDTDVAGLGPLDRPGRRLAPQPRGRRGHRLRRRPGHRRHRPGEDRGPGVHLRLRRQQRQGQGQGDREGHRAGRRRLGEHPAEAAPRGQGARGDGLPRHRGQAPLGARPRRLARRRERHPRRARRRRGRGRRRPGPDHPHGPLQGRQGADPLPRHRRARRHDEGLGHRAGARHLRRQVRPPKTQPDAVRGVVGKPLQIEPLGNDIPGADPGEPDAVLRLRAEVRPVGPLEVDTDLATGQVTVTGSVAGTFELTYSAQTGAGAAPGRVRVDLTPPPDGVPPVAVPDTATLHDQAPVMVDVLANDYSPSGDVLVTAATQADGENTWLQPSIYQGRWIRIEAREPAPLDAAGQGRRGVVRYTVSDGTQRTTGEVAVLQQGPLEDSLPLVQDDTATVREGDTVSAPVLDNDTMADGIPLQVDPASVKVVSKGDAQRAFASGNVIRYVPEARGLKAERFVTIEYAAFADGMKDRAQTARLRVAVTPLPTQQRPNQPPVARSFSATVTAGDPITMTVPTFGVDADGDSVSVTGIVGAEGGAVDLTHGRVVGIGPSTIRYEAYPLAAGTEVVSYEVRDRFGATSRAFVRVGVVQPGDPQPPVAVNDEVFAAPGKTITVKPLQNDLIARGDVVEVETEPLNDASTNKAWRVEDDNTVTTKVPADTSRLHELVYGISDGLFDPSRASVLVRPVKDWVNPPVARDDVAAPKPGEASTLVDALANDTDIDSDPETLTIVDVLSPDATIEAGQVRVTVLDHPYAVPYVIEDEDGARAMALIQVPTGANGQPFVVAGSLIQMDEDASVTVPLNDHVRSPRGRVVSVTTAETVSASPAQNLAVTLEDNRTLSLQASGGYVGPAAVMLEVTDQDAVDQKDFGTAYVSIPVQIGPKVPLLRCPDTSLRVVAGGLPRVLDIPSYCHAWLPVGMSFDDVRFDTSWRTEPDAELAVDGAGGRRLTITADTDAQTSQGVLEVRTEGLDQPVAINVGVVGLDSAELGPPRLRPISVTGLEEGQSRTVDLAGYLDSPLVAPQCSILSARVESGSGLTASSSGCTVDAHRRRAALARGHRRRRRLRRTEAPGRRPHRGDDARHPERAAPGQRRRRPRRRGPGPRVVAAPHLRRRVHGRRLHDPAHRRVHREHRVHRLAVHHHRPDERQGLHVHRHRPQRRRRRHAERPEQHRAPRHPAPPGHRRADGRPRRRHPEHRVGRPRERGQPHREVRRAGRLGGRRLQDPGRPRGLDDGDRRRARQRVRAVGAGAGVERARRRPVRPGRDDAVGRHAPGAARPGHRRERPRPGAGLGDADDLVGPGPPQRAAHDPLHPVPVDRRRAWTEVARTSPDVRTARDVIPYDGRTYRYSATVTNGADIEGPTANASSFTSVGQPSTPSLATATPDPDGRIQLTVGVGQPRAGAFTAIRWSGGGKSGTRACGCTPGTQVVFKTEAFDTSPTTSRDITVWTVNSGGSESDRVSRGATPYRATLTPTGISGTNNGTTGATWTWNLPENGRPIDQVQIRGADVGHLRRQQDRSTRSTTGPGIATPSRCAAHSAAGWSARPPGRSTVPNPPPEVFNVHKGPPYRPPNAVGSCTERRAAPGSTSTCETSPPVAEAGP